MQLNIYFIVACDSFYDIELHEFVVSHFSRSEAEALISLEEEPITSWRFVSCERIGMVDTEGSTPRVITHFFPE